MASVDHPRFLLCFWVRVSPSRRVSRGHHGKTESRIFKAAPRAWPASEDLFRAPGIGFPKGTSHARCRADAVSLEGLPPVPTAALSSAPPA